MYSVSWRRTPMQAPSAHLACKSSPRQSPFMAVKEAVCGTHSLRATRLKLGETADDTKRYTRTTYIGARSRPVNSELDPIAMTRGGMKYECSRTQRNMLWCENERSYVLCDMPWCENECSHVPTRYVMVCKMYVRVCYTIWAGAIDKLLETFVLALKQTRVAKKRNRKCALVLTLLIR